MSRIYEALEKAESERATASTSAKDHGICSLTMPFEEEQPSVTTTQPFDSIPMRPWKPCEAALPTLADSGVAVEQFRSLRSSLYQMRAQISLKTIIISSGMPAEGKTFIAANLALSLARNNERPVLLIDADLRRPSIHRLLGTPDAPGLMQYLVGSATSTEIVQRTNSAEIMNGHGARAISNMGFIPAGQNTSNLPELAGNHRIEELITSVSPHFSWIIIDSSPVMAVTDAVDLARIADGVLLVAREATTKYGTAQLAHAAFSRSRVLGFVINAAQNAPRNNYEYLYCGDGTHATSSPGTAPGGGA